MARIRIDGTRTQTLRTVLLAAMAALAIVLLGILGVKQLAKHGIHLDLPGHLGVNIQQTADGFTMSQSQNGHTIFTIHASKTVYYKGNRAELHGVKITLYGPPGTKRKDTIQGSDFVYDKAAGTVTAQGNVVIDMASPATKAPSKTAPPDTIHIETSGLTFNQNTGDAETAQPLQFTLERASGKSVGGSYNSKTGVLVLQSQVELKTDQNGVASTVDAAHAQLLRNDHLAYLLKARDTYEGNQTSADEATLHFRPDGTLQHLDAQDHVHIVTADGAQIDSSTASGDFDAQSQPVSMSANGGVNFFSSSPNSNMHGNAVQATITFVKGPDGKAQTHHAQFRNAVSFVLQQNSLGGDPRGSATREITASTVDVNFAPGPDGKALATSALGRGGAHVNLHDLPYDAPPRHTALYGQQLQAQLAFGHELRQVDGSGGTKVEYYLPDGAVDTSTGDTLHATFLPMARAKELGKQPAKGGADESAQLDSAVQSGRVTIVTQPARDARAADGTAKQGLHADGAIVTYQGSTDTLHLAGAQNEPPQARYGGLTMTATGFDYHRTTATAVATGDVRGTMIQAQNPGQNSGQKPNQAQPGTSTAGKSTAPAGGILQLGGSGPSHVVAARSVIDGNANVATFYGAGTTPARMWQGGNSVMAPVLVLSKAGSTLEAHGADGGPSKDVVHAVFLQSPAGKTKTESANASNPMRVAADTLFYSDSTRMGDFKGDVIAQQDTGTVHSEDAQVFLGEAKSGTQASGVERMVATGHVLLTQPGRRATGDKLLYTGSDGNYLLTGTDGAPPHAYDAQHGDTTGAALLMNSSDNSVQVLSHDEDGANHRTVTNTRTPK